MIDSGHRHQRSAQSRTTTTTLRTKTPILDVDPPGVLEGDIDAESEPLPVAAYDVVSQLGALVTVQPDGSFTYDPTQAAVAARL